MIQHWADINTTKEKHTNLAIKSNLKLNNNKIPNLTTSTTHKIKFHNSNKPW